MHKSITSQLFSFSTANTLENILEQNVLFLFTRTHSLRKDDQQLEAVKQDQFSRLYVQINVRMKVRLIESTSPKDSWI